ncbi:hypothetical protein M9H77_12444 [Catharanthus roseus]|uniref:Uncharacterized protein n=1 Tax=Catharanthus roseus TaxID=4058 RepID=A0ACC0BHD0_CATRO|nr:hypothetical protein M9H77_12444 [Catharanthus roseus]
MRDLLGDAWERGEGGRKRHVWIPEMFWEQMMKYWESPECKAFCERNEKNRNEGQGGGGERESTHVLQEQTLRGTPQEEAAASSTLLPDDLQLIAIVSDGLDHDRLYGAGSKAAHLRAKSGRATAGLPPCCLEADVSAAFDEHIRRFTEKSHLSYTLMPPMMDIVRTTMATVPLTSSLMAAATVTSDAARVSFSTPLPSSIHAPSTSNVDPPPFPDPLVMLEIPRIFDNCTFFVLWMF